MLSPQIQYQIVNNSSPEYPAFCNVCSVVMSTLDDTEAYNRCACCRNCEMCFFETNQEKWKNGWRPSLKQIEEKIADRQILLR